MRGRPKGRKGNPDHPGVTLLQNRKMNYVSFLHPGRGMIRTHRSLFTADPAQAKLYAIELSGVIRGEKRIEDVPEVVRAVLDETPEGEKKRNEMRRAALKGRAGRKRGNAHPYVSLQLSRSGVYAYVFKHPGLGRQVRRTLRTESERALEVAKELSQHLVSKASDLPEGCSKELQQILVYLRCQKCGASIPERRGRREMTLESCSTAALLEELKRRCGSDSR